MSDWSYPLCSRGCFSDCKICLLSWFLPCVVVGKVAEGVEGVKHTTCYFGTSRVGLIITSFVLCCFRIYLRNKLRNQKGIKGNIIKDCLYIYFCPCCSLIQEYREVQELPSGQAMARD